MYNTNEKGRSMVEMIGYMAVVIAVVMSVGHIVSSAFEEHKYSQATIQLSELAGAITKASAIDPDYSEVIGKITPTITDEGRRILPSSFSINNNTITHAFGGEVKLGLGEGGENNVFYIEYDGLDRKPCIELAMKDWTKNTVINLKAIIINQNNQWYWPSYFVEGANELPVTRDAVAGVENWGQCCTDPDNENSKCKDNTIRWLFY